MKVLKPLTTAMRRLKVGDPVEATDDFSPHTFADLKARNFIGDEPAADLPAPIPARSAAPFKPTPSTPVEG